MLEVIRTQHARTAEISLADRIVVEAGFPAQIERTVIWGGDAVGLHGSKWAWCPRSTASSRARGLVVQDTSLSGASSHCAAGARNFGCVVRRFSQGRPPGCFRDESSGRAVGIGEKGFQVEEGKREVLQVGGEWLGR